MSVNSGNKPTLRRDASNFPVQALAPQETAEVAPGAVLVIPVRHDQPGTGGPTPHVAELVRISADDDVYLEFGDASVAAAPGNLYSFLFLKGTEVLAVPEGATHLGTAVSPTALVGATTVSVSRVA